MKTPIVTVPFDGAAAESLGAYLTKGSPAAAIVWPIAEAVISGLYAHGARREWIELHATDHARPSPVAALHLLQDKTLVAKAYQRTISDIKNRLTSKARELTQEAHDALLNEAGALFAMYAAPAPKAASTKAAMSPMQKALTLIIENINTLTPDELAKLSEAVTGAQATASIQAAKAPAKTPAAELATA